MIFVHQKSISVNQSMYTEVTNKLKEDNFKLNVQDTLSIVSFYHECKKPYTLYRAWEGSSWTNRKTPCKACQVKAGLQLVL